MTKDLVLESDILKLKTLEEINEDFRRADFINLALMSSDIISVLINHLRDKSDSIRELASRSIVTFTHKYKFIKNQRIKNFK